MRWLLNVLFVGAAIATLVVPAAAQDKKSDIQGGIEGKVKSVDLDKGTLTITTDAGRERTFTVSDETTMVGPRGGVVRRRLKDPRFHEGLEITVVAKGTVATELHLGIDHKPKTNDDPPAKAPKSASTGKTTDDKVPTKRGAPAAPKPDDDDEDEFPGKIKSVDASKNLLVITLLNGKDRSFLVGSAAKIHVKGRTIRDGLADPVLRRGMSITVVTEPGGHKVKEVIVAPVAAGTKKAD